MLIVIMAVGAVVARAAVVAIGKFHVADVLETANGDIAIASIELVAGRQLL